MTLDELLDERGKRYGPYDGNSKRLLWIMSLAEFDWDTHKYPATVMYGVLMLSVKLGRLLYRPDDLDTWRDIEGYAHLVVTHLEAHVWSENDMHAKDIH